MDNNTIKIYGLDHNESVLNCIKEVCAYYEVTTEMYPEKAIEMIKNERFDIFIVDYRLPVVNGIEVLEVIKELYSDIPYVSIFSTEYGTIHLFKEEFSRDLFTYFIEKPYEFDTLRDIMKQSIETLKRLKGKNR